MKKLFFLLLLTSLSAKSQVLITWYNNDNADVMYSYMDTEVPPCATVVWKGDTITACATTKVYTFNYAKPKFNSITETYYNGATPEEQEFYEAKQYADAVPLDAITAIDTRFTTPKTNAQLDELYQQPAPFMLYCENIGDGIIYIKGTDGWRIILTENND